MLKGVLSYFKLRKFKGSEQYWKDWYAKGGNSGAGSYNELADFKAGVLNDFVEKNNIGSVIEFGCGDGNQLTLARYPLYTGVDISEHALGLCRNRFKGDPTKNFKLNSDYQGEKAELSLSLDVIYHLTEDPVYNDYMQRLFNAGSRFVIIYSSNTDENYAGLAPHQKHRKFTNWVEKNAPGWKLISHIPNRYPLDKKTGKGSHADFYIYGRKD